MSSPVYIDQFGTSATGSGEFPYGCRISLTRIVLMSVVTMGLYWLYWMYRTWRQFRDLTAGTPEQASQTHYPVWHGLTQLVPIYGFFRFHAHVREYKALAEDGGVVNSLNPGPLTVIVVIGTLLGWTGGIMGEPELFGGFILVLGIILNLIALAMSAAVLAHVQSNLNHYWDELGGTPTQNARFGKGEIVCVILGVIFWLGTIAGFIWAS